jgi:hypothetical protein
MQGIYTHIPETHHVPKEHNVAAILSLLFMAPIPLVPVLTLMYFYISTFRSMCAVPNMAVVCSSLIYYYRRRCHHHYHYHYHHILLLKFRLALRTVPYHFYLPKMRISEARGTIYTHQLYILFSLYHTPTFKCNTLRPGDRIDLRRQACFWNINSVALVRERTIPTERPPPVGEVCANFCG